MLQTDDEDMILSFLFNSSDVELDSSSDSSTSVSSLSDVEEEAVRRKRPKIEFFIEDVLRKYDEMEWKANFRMSKATTYNIIRRFEESKFIPKYAPGRKNISAEKSVLLTIWYLANTNTFREIADRFGVSISTAHECLTRVLDFIISLKSEVIQWPDRQDMERISQTFSKGSNIHGAIGAIDGSHVQIVKPLKNQDSYINRKGYHSLLLQGVVDNEKKFIDVFCGEPGSLHDARLLRRSPLFSRISDNPEMIGDYFLLGDSAYPNLHWIVTPFKDTGFLTNNQKLFNKRISSKRVVVENAFGWLKGRFRRLKSLENTDLLLCSKIILASCILHNLCLKDPTNSLDLEETDHNQPSTQLYTQLVRFKENSKQLEVLNKMFPQ